MSSQSSLDVEFKIGKILTELQNIMSLSSGCHCFYWEISSKSYCCFSEYHMLFFSVSSIFPLSFFSSNFTMMCIGTVSFEFILLRFVIFSNLCLISFINFGNSQVPSLHTFLGLYMSGNLHVPTMNTSLFGSFPYFSPFFSLSISLGILHYLHFTKFLFRCLNHLLSF